MFPPKHWMICLKRNKVDLEKSRGIGVRLAEEKRFLDMLRVESALPG
jgi:hypothetical protein